MDADRPRQVGVKTTPADVMKGPHLMRIKMFLLAAVASLATTQAVNAQAVSLGFAVNGNQNFATNPATPFSGGVGGTSGSNVNPQTSFALSSWGVSSNVVGNNHGAVLGTQANHYVVNVGTDVALSIQLWDNIADPTNNAYFGAISGPLNNWKVLLSNSNTSALRVLHDSNVSGPASQGGTEPTPPPAFEMTVNNGSNRSAENLPAANAVTSGPNPDFTSMGVGNLMTSAVDMSAFNGGSGKITLANLVLHPLANGTVVLSLSDISAGADWNGDPNADNQVFYSGSANDYKIFIDVVGAPEPSSMALVGLAVSGLAVRMRRKKAAAAAAAAATV